MTAELFAPVVAATVGALLGEGPAWIVGNAALWFVDIEGRTIFRFDPVNEHLEHWPAPERPGWVLPSTDRGLVVGLPSGPHRFNRVSGGFEAIVDLPAEPAGNRLNDAAVAPDGTLWFGTMDVAGAAPTGGLYRLVEGEAREVGVPRVPIVNGPAISPAGDCAYHVDTLGRSIWRIALDRDGAPDATSQLPREPFATIEADAGYPDGVSVDAAGNVWVGLYAGWAARCYAPDGALVRVVEFPVANVTKLAFGSDDLCTVYATTARQGLDEAALAKQPNAGDLFAFRTDVPGVPIPDIRITGGT